MTPRREIGPVKRAVRAQTRNRTPWAVERTVPFGLAVDTRIVRWHVRHGQPDADLAPHRAAAPWYRTTAHPSFPVMLTTVRRMMVAAEHPPETPGQPPGEEIQAVIRAWAQAARTPSSDHGSDET